jgi:trimethylamine--corrinoid protein Co-methyltransferase
MLDFENCQSLEKLVLDDEICSSALRLVRGVDITESATSVDLIGDAVKLGNMLGHRNTRGGFRREFLLPSVLVDRGSYSDWEAAGGRDACARAAAEVRRVVSEGNPAPLDATLAAELDRLIRAEGERLGCASLPSLE